MTTTHPGSICFKRSAIALALSAAFATTAQAATPGAPIGPIVTATTTGAQQSVASDSAGDYVVVWLDQQSDSDSPQRIFAQRYTASSVPVGTPIIVSSGIGKGLRKTSLELGPSVAMNQEGAFAVTWVEYQANGLRDNGTVYLRQFAAGGTAIANDAVVGQGLSSDVAIDRDGDVVVTWNTQTDLSISINPYNNVPNTKSTVHARRFNATGAAADAAITVDSVVASGPPKSRIFDLLQVPAVAIDSDGGFSIAWTDVHVVRQPSGLFSSSATVAARRYHPNGSARSGVIQVSEPASVSTAIQKVSVADDSGGNFVVAWTAQGSPSFPVFAVLARSFDANGNARGSGIVVAQDDDKNSSLSAAGVLSDDAGDFTVVTSLFLKGERDNSAGTVAHFMAPDGTARVPPVVLAVPPSNGPTSVAMDGSGNLVIASQPYPTGSIVARRFAGL